MEDHLLESFKVSLMLVYAGATNTSLNSTLYLTKATMTRT